MAFAARPIRADRDSPNAWLRPRARAGADAADAVAMRSVSLSVECATARSRNPSAPKATTWACASWSASAGGGLDQRHQGRRRRRRWPSARSRWRAPRPRISSPGSPIAALLARRFPDLDLIDPSCPTSPRSRAARARAEAAGLAVKGVSKSGGASASAGIGGMVLVTSHGFSRRLSRLAPQRFDARRSPAKAPAWSATTIFPRRCMLPISTRPNDRPHRRRARGRSGSTRARSRPASVPVVFDPRVAGSLVGHLVGAINGAPIARKTSFLKDKLGERLFAPGIHIIDDPLRPRGLRSRPFDGEGVAGSRMALVEDGVLKTWLLDSATGARAWPHHHRPRRSAASSSAPSPGADQPASRAGHDSARRADRRHRRTASTSPT